MRNKMFRIGVLLLMIVMVTGELGVGAFATENPNKNSFVLINSTDLSISEVYFYPCGSKSLGRCRNNTWLRSDMEAMIEFTEAERLNQYWNIKIGFSRNGKIVYEEWEEIELQSFIDAEKVTLTYDIIEGYQFDLEIGAFVDEMMETMGSTGRDRDYFTFVNFSGYDIAEFYIYASNSRTCGKSRNSGKVEDMDSFDVQLTDYERTANVTWNMKIGLYNGHYISYLVMEGFEMDLLLNCESVVFMRNGQNFSLHFSDIPMGF